MEKQLNTVGSSTYEKIKHDIIFGELAPGSKLKLDVIKTKYEASVSTLRAVSYTHLTLPTTLTV